MKNNKEKVLQILKYLLDYSVERDRRENPKMKGDDFWTFNIKSCIFLLEEGDNNVNKEIHRANKKNR